MGVWLAFRVRNPTRMIRYVTRHGGIVLMAGVILVSCVRLLPLPATFGLTIGFTLTYIAACSILIGSLNFNWHQNKEAPSKLVSILGPLTALIGRNSYSIYLWHVAAIGFAERMTKKIIDGYVESANIIWLLNATSAVLVSVVVGIGFGYLIEWPFVKLRDKLFPSRAKALPLNEVASEDARGCAIK
jgi:peptidoglycan/LPS O-acetylase OafA/YrhL